MIKSRITLKQLEAFAFVVDTGTFRAAAAALGTTQPNISARIASLETALGVTLLYRDAGSVRLTETGTTVLAKARDVLWAGEALLEVIDRQDLIEERLRLGVTELVACTWLQPFLRLLKAEYPNLRVALQVDLSEMIEASLQAGHVDLALQSGPFKTTLKATTPLCTENYVWVAQPDVARSIGPRGTVKRFFQYPVITHAKHTQAGRALHDMAEARSLDTAQIVHSSSLSACVPMVCEGMGVALLPASLIRSEIADGELSVLESDWGPKPLSFFARFHAERMPRFVNQAASLAAQVASSQPDDKFSRSLQENKSI